MLIAAQNRKLEGMRSMVTAFVLLLITTLLLVIGDRAPAFFAHVLANLLLILGFSFLHFSFPEVRRRPRLQRNISIALAAFLTAGCILFTHIVDSHAARALVVSIAVAIQASATSIILFRVADPAVRYPSRCTATIFALAAAVQVSRAVYILAHRTAPDEAADSPIRWLVLLGYAVMCATVPILYFWTMTVRLQGRLEHLAFTDSLTGLHNRRSIEQEGAIELSRLLRTPSAGPLSLILFDLDSFKQLNDLHGHPAGDYVLHSLPSVLTPCLRAFDRLARIGGEEFLILLPGTNSDQAFLIADRIRLLLESADFAYDGQRLPVTASFGLATTSALAENWSTLIHRADANLYQAKQSGRNLVVR